MVATVPRLLRLLALLQTQPSWTAAALADQLGVTTRTIRVDIQRLRSLGYQVDADRASAADTGYGRHPHTRSRTATAIYRH